jgi:glycosyltransferase involved in cell wall biosynthesis
MQANSKPFFSIITSTLNAAGTIGRCIQSVAVQTFEGREHIVVDGASTDGTAELLHSRRDQFSVLISEPDTGIYSAWNKALLNARGEWIFFLGGDDVLADAEVLADVAEFIGKNGLQGGIVYGDVLLVKEESYTELEHRRVDPRRICRQSFFDIVPGIPPHPSVFHHRSLFSQFGRFDEKFRIAADTKFILNALCIHKSPWTHIPRTVNRVTARGISTTGGMNVVREQLAVLKDLSLRCSFAAKVRYAAKPFLRSILKKMLGERNTRRLIDFFR